MTTYKELEKLNRREPKPILMARLMTEACGKPAPVGLSDALEFRRNQYDLTCYEFSMMLGLQKSHYSEVIHGLRDLPIKSVKRAYAIGVPADVLLAPSSVRGEI